MGMRKINLGGERAQDRYVVRLVVCGPEEDPLIKLWTLLMDGFQFTLRKGFLGVKAI